MKKMIIALLILFLIIGSLIFYIRLNSNDRLPTYFKYTKEEMQELNHLKSSQEITQDSLHKWDDIMFSLIKAHKLGDTYASSIYAYVYVAQKEAAFLSKNATHQFIGSIEPITAEVLCIFFTDSCFYIQTKIKVNPDTYSKTLSAIVLQHIKTRINEDKNQQHLFSEKMLQDKYWIGIRPFYGQNVGSWKTWLIESGHLFVAPPPPPENSPMWQKQLEQVHTALKSITPDQTTSVVFWAGNPSTITPPGIWLVFANDYMKAHPVSLAKELYIRAILAMGIADSVITVFNSKYTYWVRRPFMRDPMIHTVMPTPNHPSYPAGHSALSATAATILSCYFPENEKEWKKLAKTASMGRVWGGIHFPIDAEQGAILGNKVGNEIIQKVPSLSTIK